MLKALVATPDEETQTNEVFMKRFLALAAIGVALMAGPALALASPDAAETPFETLALDVTAPDLALVADEAIEIHDGQTFPHPSTAHEKRQIPLGVMVADINHIQPDYALSGGDG